MILAWDMFCYLFLKSAQTDNTQLSQYLFILSILKIIFINLMEGFYSIKDTMCRVTDTYHSERKYLQCVNGQVTISRIYKEFLKVHKKNLTLQ